MHPLLNYKPAYSHNALQEVKNLLWDQSQIKKKWTMLKLLKLIPLALMYCIEFSKLESILSQHLKCCGTIAINVESVMHACSKLAIYCRGWNREKSGRLNERGICKTPTGGILCMQVGPFGDQLSLSTQNKCLWKWQNITKTNKLYVHWLRCTL